MLEAAVASTTILTPGKDDVAVRNFETESYKFARSEGSEAKTGVFGREAMVDG